MQFLYQVIRDERKRRNMPLKELSRHSGVSSGLISSIERGIVNPSIDVVLRICKSLQIHPTRIIRPADDAGELVIMKRQDQYGIVDRKSSTFVITPIHPRRSKNAVLVTYVNPRQEFGRKHISQETAELVVVMNGRVKLFYGESEHVLETGDSAYFTADRIHYVRNLCAKKAVLVWCVFDK